MKRNFFSGLVLLLPIVLTISIIMFFVNRLTKPFEGIVESLFGYLGWLDQSFFFLTGQQLVDLTSKVLILFLLAALTLFIGFLGKHFFLDALLTKIDRLIHRIPIVNRIYKAFQEVMDTLFKSKSASFSQVVLIPYPHDRTYAIGFITKETLPENSDQRYQNLITVFVPGTPNPTIGFSMLYRKEQLVFLDMKVEEALKFLMSCGMQLAEFKTK